MSNEKKVITSPLQAIKAFCIECSGGSRHEAFNCPEEKCVLHPFRKGRNSLAKRQMTEEQKAAAAERLRLSRERKKAESED